MGMAVEVYAWNPKRPTIGGRLGKHLPLRRPVNNFGDLLGPVVVKGLVRNAGLDPQAGGGRLLSVGSVLHFARDGDVIWGTGVNGKVDSSKHQFTRLDVRAVRGPLTRDFLISRSIKVPPIYGDPALLLPETVPELHGWVGEPTRDVTVVPNFHDYPEWCDLGVVLDPRRPLRKCLEAIARSRLVVGSSLHAIVVAESLGIPARTVRSQVEHETKYADYYLGTGRPDFTIAASVEEAISLGGEQPPQWSPEPLRESFPYDLWSPS